MKYIAKPLGLLLTVLLVTGQCRSQSVATPRTPSPAAEVTQTIGISKIQVKYSRPSVKGRKVWGEIVPFGWNVQSFGTGNSAPWRAGANENTIISFSHDVKVESIQVPAGVYGLFFVVNPDGSGEIILSRNSRSWGSFFYDKNEDQMRAPIKTIDNTDFTESLTYDFTNLTKNSGSLILKWEKKQFPVKIEFAVDEIVMANAKQELRGSGFFTSQAYISAASYSLNNDINLEQGLAWIDQLINNGFAPNFTVLSIRSDLLRKLNKNTEADKTLEEGMAIASESEINVYGYQLLGQAKHDKAIEIFLANTRRYPGSANAWDSLGEGYATKGDKANAITSYKKALTLNPSQIVRESSEKALQKLATP